ncbi:hypothetical protein, partial [Lacticaseibacillus casei]
NFYLITACSGIVLNDWLTCSCNLRKNQKTSLTHFFSRDDSSVHLCNPSISQDRGAFLNSNVP